MVVTTQTEDEALALVSGRKADMTMRSLIVAASTIRKQGLFNLKIAGQIPDYANASHGRGEGRPVLRAILDKGVATITPRERDQSVARHTAINVQMGVDYNLVAKVALAALAVLAWLVLDLAPANPESGAEAPVGNRPAHRPVQPLPARRAPARGIRARPGATTRPCRW